MDLYNVTLLTDLSLDFLIDSLEQAGRSLVIFYEETEAHPCRIYGQIHSCHLISNLSDMWSYRPYGQFSLDKTVDHISGMACSTDEAILQKHKEQQELGGGSS